MEHGKALEEGLYDDWQGPLNSSSTSPGINRTEDEGSVEVRVSSPG